MFETNAMRFIFIIFCLGIATGERCQNTKYTVSSCDSLNQYQWLIEIPATKNACVRKSVAEPLSVECNFACSMGQTFDRDLLRCTNCTAGTFSLGGGRQYTFNEGEDLKKTSPDLSLEVKPISALHKAECKKDSLWRVKGSVLQGELKSNCVIYLTLRFTIERPGSITIVYNLATSYVFGTIVSRCDFSIKSSDDDEYADDDDSADDDSKKRFFTFPPTGYGVWQSKKIPIDAPGDYKLSLSTLSFYTFHFPLSIRSIVVEGSSYIQDCIPCPAGTYAPDAGSSDCIPCDKNTYASAEGARECLPCSDKKLYSEEGSSSCVARPTCELKHYRKVFTGCDASDVAIVKYEPIQPKICINNDFIPEKKQAPCKTCNPGMYKNKETGRCEFCGQKSYSNGTTSECLPCASELSLVYGLYYKNWNDLPIYLNRSYLSVDESKSTKSLAHDQSWIPSIDYISSQALPDSLSILSLSITKGFRTSEIQSASREFGTLYFNFSVQCQSAVCELFLVTQDIYDENNDWDVINKWDFDKNAKHSNRLEYRYSVPYPEAVVFSWLFAASNPSGDDEIRIYEISVTNTVLGGSDRCVSCLTANNQETECKDCTPGYILSNSTCKRCPTSTIARRIRLHDPVPTKCEKCPNDTISDDGISCYVPCKQSFQGNIQYDLSQISTIDFHGSKLFTQKGSGYFHVFNATICGKTSVSCSKTSTADESKRSKTQTKVESKLCRLGIVPDKDGNLTSVAYIDDFGEQLLNVSLTTSDFFPPLRSDYSLPDITLVYRANSSAAQSTCSERITFLSLRCDYLFDSEKHDAPVKYKLQTPSDCVTGTCDGCTFHFLLRTPFACPICDGNTNGFRSFFGPCRFGRQEVRKIPYPYCAQNITETVENRRCSILSIEVQIIIGLFVIIAGILVSIVILCWRKNRKLEYRYMQLIENTNPDDDTPVDNVCAQISDEEESGDEVQYRTQSRTRKIINAVRNAIGKNSNSGPSDSQGRDSFLLTNTMADEA